MSPYFTSDPHFGHQKLVKGGHRPWTTTADMNSALTMRWNAVVPPRAPVYVLGDFAFMHPRDAVKILSELNGVIHLVPGNHDSKDMLKTLSKNFDERKLVIEPQYLELKSSCYYQSNPDGKDDSEKVRRRIVLCHFPIESWNMMHYGSIHLHGHSHGNSRKVPNRFDVGIDAVGDFAPKPLSYFVDQATDMVPRPDRPQEIT